MDNSSLNKNNKDGAVDENKDGAVDEKDVERDVEKKGDKKAAEKKGWRKRIRDFIVDKHVDIIKRSGIPLDLACLIIKIVHFRLPFDLMLAASMSSPFTGLCIWLFVMSVFFMYNEATVTKSFPSVRKSV